MFINIVLFIILQVSLKWIEVLPFTYHHNISIVYTLTYL